MERRVAVTVLMSQVYLKDDESDARCTNLRLLRPVLKQELHHLDPAVEGGPVQD